jgi:membrane-bound ClpP family serine protease
MLFLVGAALVLIDTVAQRRAVIVLGAVACAVIESAAALPLPDALVLVSGLAAVTLALGTLGTVRPPQRC